MTEDTTWSASRDGDAFVVIGKGELDLRKTNLMWDLMEEGIKSESPVVVDLRQSVFIDTAVLACLAKGGQLLAKQERRLQVKVKAKTHPDRVLQTVQFHGLMDITVE